MNRRAPALIAFTVLTALALTGCAQGLPPAGAAPSTTGTPALRGSIRVAAAASLDTVLPALSATFQQQHPGTTITFDFGGSSSLATAIVAGAPVDVFAAASARTMRTVSDASLTAATPVVVARNELEIAVPPGNPGRIAGLRDFADPAKTIVVCDRVVPCGAAAAQVFALARITPKPDSEEPDVTSVLTKVEGNEADAGLVYATDVRAAGPKVEGIAFPEAHRAITAYPIATIRGSRNTALADAWVAFVEAHERDLQAAGFLAP